MAAEKTAPEKKEHAKHEGSVKETIESILVAFILAFVFRAFVVEAFVIPTGSMGPTLMGAHMRLECPDCGYAFQANFSNLGGDDTDIPSSVPTGPNSSKTCPNCGFRVPLHNPEPVYFGDRILVLKYRYLFEEPKRWDVVVFKSPFEKARDEKDPKYTDNFIKRLIGKPGESIMVLDGDVYVGHKGMKPPEFEIQRKPAYAENALWRDVYDNDYLPHGQDRGLGAVWEEPWQVESGSGWQGPAGAGAASRRFQFNNPQGASTLHFESSANHATFDSLTDWLAYDQSHSHSSPYVGDLKLRCAYHRQAGDGPLTMQLTKRKDCFTADILPGKVVLRRQPILDAEPLRLGPAIWTREAIVPELGKLQTPVEIELSNVDYRVSVSVNRTAVLTTNDADYRPDVAGLYDEALRAHREGKDSLTPKPIVRLIAGQQTCSIEHLRLARDVYYLNYDARGHLLADGQYSYQPYWGSPENIQDLGPDEYFVMGDNSQVSLDARFWGAPVSLPHEGGYEAGSGRVPGRFMLGKAFFVYWPAGYRPPAFPFGIEPDFGDMRFIH